MRDLRLRPTIAVVLILGILVPVLLVGWMTVKEQRKSLWQALSDDHERLLDILVLGIQEPLWTLHREAGQPLINAIMTDKRVARIVVESEDSIFLEKAKTNVRVEHIQSRSKDVVFHGRTIGKVVIDIDLSHLQTAIRDQSSHYLLLFLIPFLLSSIVLFLLLRHKVIQPLEELIGQSENLSAKKLDEPFIWRQRDELGKLGHSLEQTRISLRTAFGELEKLHAEAITHSQELENINKQLHNEIRERTLAEERLREHRNTLEITVKKRTVELVEANKNLVQEMEERKKIEEESRLIALRLHRAEKMEALGILASGVAHDLNNILAGIVSYPELLMLKIGKENELYQPISEINEAGKRAAAVVADLLTIARSTSTILIPHNLQTITQEYLASPEFHKLDESYPDVSLDFSCQTTEPIVECSPIHIKKCIMNLITNSYEASRKNSSVSAVISKKELSTPELSGTYYVLEIQDTGHGIHDTDLDRIFEPFFSTKQLGMSGSGLGLAIVWNTMQEHNGWVAASSDHNGTIFSLFFPASQKKHENQSLNEGEDFRGNNEHILVVDDEPMLLKIAERMLTGMGYDVITAASGEEAVELLHGKKVDAVVLDMMMEPGMNGRQTYEQIVKIHPTQKAMIVSGFAMNDDIRAALKMGVTTFLKKPYSMEELGLAIKKTLLT